MVISDKNASYLKECDSVDLVIPIMLCVFEQSRDERRAEDRHLWTQRISQLQCLTQPTV